MKTETQITDTTALNKTAVIGSSVVWSAPENSDSSTTLSQHAFVSKQRGEWFEEKYEGNESLCGRIGIVNENERYITVDEIDKEK